jgi:hypothetical protein
MLKRWEAWPRGIRWLIGGIVAVVLALVIAWVLVVPAADWLARHDVGSPKGALLQTARDAARGRLLTLGAGLFAAGALIFTALNFNLLRSNSEQTDRWQRRTYELTEQGQVTDRYTKAIEQLGSDKLDVRIGGIYALERVARDSARDNPTVMEVLTAFIRQYSREQWPPPGRETGRWTRPDVQAAVTVIGRRDVKRGERRIDLYGANLTAAYLRDANLRDATLGYATLDRAYLRGAILVDTDLRNATIRDAQHLDEADLTGAKWSGDAPVGWERDTAGLLKRGTTGRPTPGQQQ